MTPRLSIHVPIRRAAAAVLILAAGLVAVAGCDPRPFMYFLQPFEPMVEPPFKGTLEKKKIVVLTHAVSGTQNDFLSIDRDLAREFSKILREKVKKIDLVNQDKVWDWVEGHPNWTDPADAARAFEADLVIFLEIESFQIQDPHSPGLLEGTARTHMQAVELVYPKNSKGKELHDQPKEPEVVYDDYRDTTFPTRGPIQEGSGVSRGAFKTKFLQVVAAEVSWHFVEHSPEDDIQDARINNR
jgi:hypothetical protein